MRRRDPEYQMADPPEITTQGAPCVRCGGLLDPTVLPFHQARYPGEVRVRCTRCGLVETPEMRRAALALESAPIPKREKLQTLTCNGCGVTFQKAGRKWAKYCSRPCATSSNWALKNPDLARSA